MRVSQVKGPGREGVTGNFLGTAMGRGRDCPAGEAKMASKEEVPDSPPDLG